jgi:hypothetical protein
MTDAADFVRETVVELLAAQLRDDAPAEARHTLARLVASGYTDEEARALIGCAIANELHVSLGTDERFDESRYVASLGRLPALPWD